MRQLNERKELYAGKQKKELKKAMSQHELEWELPFNVSGQYLTIVFQYLTIGFQLLTIGLLQIKKDSPKKKKAEEEESQETTTSQAIDELAGLASVIS